MSAPIPKGFGSDEQDADAVELRQQVGQRARGPAVGQVAADGHGEAVDGAEGLMDGVEVQQGLGGVLSGAVAGVDDGHRAVPGGPLGGADFVVAQRDYVGVVLAQDADGVLPGSRP